LDKKLSAKIRRVPSAVYECVSGDLSVDPLGSAYIFFMASELFIERRVVRTGLFEIVLKEQHGNRYEILEESF
jgi:hypothetical protein